MFSKKSLFNEKTLLAVGVPGSQGGKNMLRMRFCLFLAFCLLLLPLSVAQAQVTEEWVARYNGPGNDSDIAYALAVDSWGNVYVTGESHGSGTGEDYSTVKYDSDGNELWVARYDGPGSGDDRARALAVDASGNVYVTGYSYGGGTGHDYATIKYDTNGYQIWVVRYDGGNGSDYARALAVDASGNVYVTGYSAGSWTGAIATIKYDPDGNEIWVARYGGEDEWTTYSASALAVDASGNVYVTGTESEEMMPEYSLYITIKYDPDGNKIWSTRYGGDCSSAVDIALDYWGNVYVTGSSCDDMCQECDYATVKYDPDGNEIWVARYDGSENDDGARALAVDYFGNVYVTGYSYGSGTGEDYSTVKYDSDGNEIWVARYGESEDDDGARALAVDASGNVYVTGYSYGGGTEYDYATIKYDTNGYQIWVVRYDGPENDVDQAWALAVDASGNVYVTGYSYGGWTEDDYATIKYSQQQPPSPTLVCKTDKPIYNPWERVQVLADVGYTGLSFDAKLLGGIIVVRPTPKKPLTLTGEVVTKTINPGLNPDIPLYESRPFITGVVASDGTHGAFSVLYTDLYGILAIDVSTWGLTEPADVAQEKFFEELIRSYIRRYGVENLQNVNAEDVLASPVSDVPSQTALRSAFPTPSNPETWFPFQLSESSEVRIEIHNASGQLVKTLHLGYKEAGYYLNREKAAFWDGKNDRGERVASGIYFYTMQTRNFTATGKVVILK